MDDGNTIHQHGSNIAYTYYSFTALVEQFIEI